MDMLSPHLDFPESGGQELEGHFNLVGARASSDICRLTLPGQVGRSCTAMVRRLMGKLTA